MCPFVNRTRCCTDVFTKLNKSNFNGRMASWFSWSLLLLVFLSQNHCVLSQRFNVIATKTPVTSTVGSDVTVSFHLSLERNAENMDIAISRSPNHLVFYYRNGQEVTESQMKEYKGRTKFEKGNLKQGKISLVIQDVVPFDNGTYHCFFQSEKYHNEAVLDVLVFAIGTHPVIRMTRDNRGITAECESEEWYPLPAILWKDSRGNDLDSLSKKTQNSSGLFTVYSSALVKSNEEISCSIKAILPAIERRPGIIISDTVYYRVDRRVTSSIIIASPFLVCILLLFIVSYWWMAPLYESLNELKAKIKSKEAREHQARLSELEKYLNATKVIMNLDAETAHAKIAVLEDKKEARCGQVKQPGLADSQKRFARNLFVLVDKELAEGVHYLDFTVKNDLCSVGVCKQSLNRKERINVKKNKGICLVQLWDDDAVDYSIEETQKLRFYLDCSAKNFTLVHMRKVGKVELKSESFKHLEEAVFILFLIREGNSVTLL
uniref:Uncharacterized protein n=1 Tax=Leptobrachium leishanense TaxID=445787 RepID=A0A8C5QYK5_9ANUR